jgi:pilus assembly protein Flp/PilA
MKETLLKLSAKLKGLMREEGQDLIEYALVVALIAFAATAAMRTLATDINGVYTAVGVALQADSAVTP